MKFLALLLLLSALPAFAQFTPRLEISGSFTSVAQANAARGIITNKLAQLRSGAADVLDRGFSNNTNTATVTASTIIGFANTNLLHAATTWLQTNAFPGQGWTITVNSHLHPTNAASYPANWLGCRLDPRAEHFAFTITP